MIRTRFAPSPTGYVHIGSLRAALFPYLFARHNKGTFILRVEDTDQSRYVESAVKNLLETLAWAGITTDEGPYLDKNGEVKQKGKHGPYIQSERTDIYKKYAAELVDKGTAYFCFCTTERLEELREKQQKNKLPTGYDGYCASLVPVEAEKRAKAGEKHVIRLKMPKEGETTWVDIIRGPVTFKNSLVDDQVLIKADGFPTYHMAVVVDDHEMQITHVIRGEDWISSTPKHLQLYKYFGWETPVFGHMPLIFNTDKTKLSKRQGDVAVEDFRAKGYLPEALVNFIAFLGWNPGDNRELFTLSELVKEFNIEKVSKAGAVFNLEKLDWYNKEYLKQMSLSDLAERALPWFEKADWFKNSKQFEPALALESGRVATLSELPEAVKFIFALSEYEANLLIWRKSTLEEVQKILLELKDYLASLKKWNKASLETKIREWIKEKGYATGSVLWPLRVSLSGAQNSPGPYEIAEVLGKEESLKRLEAAIIKLQS